VKARPVVPDDEETAPHEPAQPAAAFGGAAAIGALGDVVALMASEERGGNRRPRGQTKPWPQALSG